MFEQVKVVFSNHLLILFYLLAIIQVSRLSSQSTFKEGSKFNCHGWKSKSILHVLALFCY